MWRNSLSHEPIRPAGFGRIGSITRNRATPPGSLTRQPALLPGLLHTRSQSLRLLLLMTLQSVHGTQPITSNPVSRLRFFGCAEHSPATRSRRPPDDLVVPSRSCVARSSAIRLRQLRGSYSPRARRRSSMSSRRSNSKHSACGPTWRRQVARLRACSRLAR